MTVAERVAELVALHGLDADAAGRLLALLELVARDPHAPSAVRDRERAVDVHVADSLSALALPAVRGASRIADIGSGAGFPGIALAIALPGSRVALVESNARKCEFLTRACHAAAVDNTEVVRGRVEEWSAGQSSLDLVTARALDELAVVCEYAAPLLAIGGTLVAWKGTVSQAELDGGRRAAAELGLAPAGVVRASPYPGSSAHHLHAYVKTSETPTRFPRRPGAARKQPLGRRR
ncbi:MAG: 16S rRNA (guanine(527)-N(7))-methyltransferase RsmG [Solirubrobacteraceae bacterium]|jgi:16S rRNA (guanine527-N7)-methyltransferase